MKKILLALSAVALLAAVTACGPKHPAPVNPNATPEAKALLAQLYQSVDEGKIIAGLHHGSRAGISYDMKRIAKASGKEPIVWGGELAWNGYQTIEAAKEEFKTGHIITLMWHSARPNERAGIDPHSDLTDEEWNDLVTEGTEMHNLWLKQIDSVAVNFLKPLQELNIPVLWRPYHEMNGEWFWWGWKEGENGFAKMYQMMWDRYVNYHHLDNILWVWNANAPRDIPGDTARAYDLYYPGNEYVDVLATDVYNRDWKQSHHDQLIELGGGKLITLGELGSLPTPEMLDNMNKYAWFMIWSGFTSDKYNSLDEIAAVFNRPNTISFEAQPEAYEE